MSFKRQGTGLDLRSTRYSLRQSPSDVRDHIYQRTDLPLRDSVSLREWASVVEDQGELGSCSSNAMTNTYELLVKKEKPDEFTELSRLFIYYNTRLLENDVSEDKGGTIKESIQSVVKFGVCSETLWPYDIDKFDDKPSNESYENGWPRTISEYQLLKNTGDVLDALNNNRPVVFGMFLYAGFDTLNSEDSTVYLPRFRSEPIGAHAMSMVGYDLDKQLFFAKNSFGTEWGDGGYCSIPFDYIRTQAFDMWVFNILDRSPIL